MCAVHAASGPAAGAGLGFYSYLRFHVDTRSFRRWGSAGPAGDESPCAVIERGEDPLAPPIPVAPPVEALPPPALQPAPPPNPGPPVAEPGAPSPPNRAQT
jgi:hypothetical protein